MFKEKRVRVKSEHYQGYRESQLIHPSAHTIQIPQLSKQLECQISPTGQMQQVAQLLSQDSNSAPSFSIHRNFLHDFFFFSPWFLTWTFLYFLSGETAPMILAWLRILSLSG